MRDMDWLVGTENSLFDEPCVDCQRCEVHPPLKRTEEFTVEFKCCEFVPFWSGFAAGAWLYDKGSLDHLKDSKPIYTTLGVMHSLEDRRKPSSLCQHFNVVDRNCFIWKQRPATCASFYCATSRAEGLSYYKNQEEQWLNQEASLLRQWFFENGGTDELWSHWGEYMEKTPLVKTLDSRLELVSFEQAQEHYKNQYLWLRTRGL